MAGKRTQGRGGGRTVAEGEVASLCRQTCDPNGGLNEVYQQCGDIVTKAVNETCNLN